MEKVAFAGVQPVCAGEEEPCGDAPLRIAMATDFPPNPEDPCGGVQAVSVHLVRALAALAGMQVHVVTQDPSCITPRKSDWGNVRVHRLPRPGKSTLANATGPGRRQIKEYLQDLAPDIVHAHDVYGLMVKGLELPRVFTIHGQIYRDTRVSEGRWSAIRSWIWKRIEQGGWADQPHVISISPYVREQLSGIVSGVIHDIDNPIGESCFHLRRQETRGRIFSAGAICPRKNTLGLIRAFSLLREMGTEAELRLSGGGDKEYLESVRKMVHAQGLEGRVTLLGRASYATIQDEMSRAAVFTLVSLEENSPMAIEEAMAAGVPVVTSNRCGMPYLVRDGESGLLVDPRNPHDIALRLRQLLEDQTLRQAMGRKGRETAMDRFHPAKVAERTRDVYRRAVEAFQRRKP